MSLLPGVLLTLLLAAAEPLSAAVTLLVCEPYGKFGFFNPTGHAAVYLSNVCAETPTTLRPCRAGETGVVISRYNRIGGHDWIAVPLLPYFYAVTTAGEVPEFADDHTVAALRDAYRRAHLRELAPDAPGGEAPSGDWVQLVGAAYDRSVYGITLETTPEQDERLIRYLNGKPNRRKFNLLYRNCADFARAVVNFYYPHALRRSLIADAGISTPKHSAKSLVTYSRKRELAAACFLVPQIPGGRPSTRIRGVSESLVRSKKYIGPLLVLQPWLAVTAAAAYLTSGRFNPARQPHTVCEPHNLPACGGIERDVVVVVGESGVTASAGGAQPDLARSISP